MSELNLQAPAAKEKLLTAYRDLATAYQRASEATTAFVNLVGDASTGEIFQTLGAVPVALPAFGAQSAVGSKKSKSKDDDEEGGKKKKHKKAKDPNAPKRPPSAYIEFQNEVRNRFRGDEPDLPYAEVLRRISSAWTNLPEEEKKVYQDRVADNRVKYEHDKAIYEQEHPNAAANPGSPDGDILVSTDGTKKVGKDGKEYTGKKRGRKSNAEKAAIASAAATSNAAIDPVQVAQLVEKSQLESAGADLPVTEPKEKKKKDKAPKVPVKPPSPEPESSDEDSDDDDSDDDSDEDDSDEDEEDEPAPPPIPVATTSKSNGKNVKRTAEVEKSEKKKKKKTE